MVFEFSHIRKSRTVTVPNTDDTPRIDEDKIVRKAQRLPQPVGDHDHGARVTERRDALLDRPCRRDVQRRRRFVEQQEGRAKCQRPWEAQPLLLPARQAKGVLVQPVMHLIP